MPRFPSQDPPEASPDSFRPALSVLHAFLPSSLCSPLPICAAFPSGSSCPVWRLQEAMRGSYPWSRRRCRGRRLRGPGADLGRPRDPFPGASRPRDQAGPKRPGQRSFLLLCAPGEGWALPVSWCAERGQTSEPLGQALSAVLKEARPPTSPDCACRPQLLLPALPPRPAAPPSQVPGASARPTPARPWEAALGSSILSSSPALWPGIRPKRVLHLVVPALSRLRPPGSIVQAADPQTPIGLQSRLLLRLWPQELPCSTVVSGLRNFLHSRPPQHAMPLGLRPQPPPTPLRQPEEGRLEQQLLRRTHGQRVPRHPSDRGT